MQPPLPTKNPETAITRSPTRARAPAPVASTTPATYYHPHGPMAAAVRIVGTKKAMLGQTGRFGVVGLGAG